jgi:hypothetical protein
MQTRRPALDAHIGRRGGELLGHGQLVLVDIDTPVASTWST